MHKLYYSRDYCLAAHDFDTTRKASWIADSLEWKPVEGVQLVEPSLLSLDTLTETHSKEYVDAVRTGEPIELAQSQGFDWCENVFTSAIASTSGVVAAALSAMEDGISGSLSSGLHHARREAGLGFCTFNGLVIAAKEAMKAGAEDVLILDLDAHGGGGTESLISGEVRIRHLDLVVDPFDTHRGSIVVRRPMDYLSVLDESLRAASSPSLVIYNAGMDVADSDCGPPGFGNNIIAARESIVFGWAAERGVPIAYAMAGGYTSPERTKADLVGHHRCTIRAAAYYSSRKDSSWAAAATQ